MEVEITSTGIFAKTIPFRDKPVNKALAKFNLEKELILLRSLVQSIKKQIAYEKIEIFGPLEIEATTLSDLTHDQIDRALFSVSNQFNLDSFPLAYPFQFHIHSSPRH